MGQCERRKEGERGRVILGKKEIGRVEKREREGKSDGEKEGKREIREKGKKRRGEE